MGRGQVVGCEAGERLRLAAAVGDMVVGLLVGLLELPLKSVELVGRCPSRCAHHMDNYKSRKNFYFPAV